MSDITISGTMRLKSGYLDVQKSLGLFGIDIEAAYPAAIARTYVLSSTPTTLDMGDITGDDVALVYMRNLDAESDGATIAYYGTDGAVPFGKLHNGEPCMFTCAPADVQLWASAEDTANLWVAVLKLS